MARPRSGDKRIALMAAATRVIVAQGLSAPTAMIAQEAGVSSGSLFTYFQTKADLLNELFLELKAEMAQAILSNLPAKAELHDQFLQAWRNWMNWAVANPHKRKALAQLNVSEEITAETRMAAHKAMAPLAEFLERGLAHGPMKDAPLAFVVAIMNSIAEATMDFMVEDPINADEHCKTSFNAFWRMIA